MSTDRPDLWKAADEIANGVMAACDDNIDAAIVLCHALVIINETIKPPGATVDDLVEVVSTTLRMSATDVAKMVPNARQQVG